MSDYDVIVIGSGFGGSVTALRLSEKGYRVAVLEAGPRYRDEEFAKTSWRLRKFLWAPKLGLTGVQRIHVLKDVVVLAGAGVGGGSLNYANTLYVPPAKFFNDPQWASITDWASELAPFYDQAARMLGVEDNPMMTRADEVMKAVADEMGVGHTFRLTPVGVYFGDGPGVTKEDPYFGGVGPARTGCTHCGECMTGCRHNAKNTLAKNYLHLAELAGAQIFPMTTVTGFTELTDGRWSVELAKTGLRKGRKTITADQLVLAAGTYNTQRLLHRMRDEGKLPRLSKMLGKKSRTNSESIMGAIASDPTRDFTQGVAITSSFYPEEGTHVEPVRYGKGSNVMGLLQTVLTDAEPGVPRWKTWVKAIATQPVQAAKLLNVHRWSERAVISLVMQTADNSVNVQSTKGRFGWWRLTSTQGDGEPNPTYIPIANEVVRKMAARINGTPGGNIGDSLGAAMTAHFVGGAVIGESADTGVIDAYHRVFEYPTLHVVDGAAVTANLGVNPSLTITAQAERAMSMWPNKGQADPRPEQSLPYKPVAAVPPVSPVVPKGAVGELLLPIPTTTVPS